MLRPGSRCSPGGAPGREDRRVLVAQGDVVELVEDLHDLLFTTLLAGGQPLGSLQIVQPTQALHLADHYLSVLPFLASHLYPQSIGARIVARCTLRAPLVGTFQPSACTFSTSARLLRGLVSFFLPFRARPAAHEVHGGAPRQLPESEEGVSLCVLTRRDGALPTSGLL